MMVVLVAVFIVVIVFVVLVMLFVVAMVVSVVILIEINLIALALDGVDPSGGSGCLVEVEHLGVQKFVKIDVAVVTLEYGHLRIQGLNYAADPAEFLGLHLRGLVQEHDVAELNLLDHKVLKVILLQIVFLESVPAGELALHPQRVHHGHDAVEFRNIRLGIFRNKLRE